VQVPCKRLSFLPLSWEVAGGRVVVGVGGGKAKQKEGMSSER